MRPSDRLVVEAAYSVWAARDLPATMECFAEDVVFVIHLPAEVAPFVGEVRGRDQVRPRLQAILDEFDFLEYTPLHITIYGGSFHSRVRFRYRHKVTGHIYDGTMRHVWRVEGDRIVHFEEFHDAERVRAFFALLAQSSRGSAGE
jgi:ketosteroid isomerase-like protein